MFTNLEDGATLPATIDDTNAGEGALGVSLGARHYGSGLGVVGAYTHSFSGVFTHYGVHTVEGRLSERLALHRTERFEVSLLLEAGAYYLEGGGYQGCSFAFSDTCTPTTVGVVGVGAVGVVGVMFRYDAFLAGLEVDYRHTEGVRGPLDSQEDVLVLGRVGVAFDVR